MPGRQWCGSNNPTFASVWRSSWRRLGRCSIFRCPGERLLGSYSNCIKTPVVRQNSSSLATEGAWNPESLFDMFLHGLSLEVKDELAARELPIDSRPYRPMGGYGKRRSVPSQARSFTAPTLSPRNPGSSRRPPYRENPVSPKFPWESPRTFLDPGR